VKLRRYNDGSWETLSTVKTKNDEHSVYFEASTPGFSPFAITGMSLSQDEDKGVDQNGENTVTVNSNDLRPPESNGDTDENNTLPMLHPVFMILILLVVSIMIRQQN
jgi:hypothetical protein